jgi:hypothetical protein
MALRAFPWIEEGSAWAREALDNSATGKQLVSIKTTREYLIVITPVIGNLVNFSRLSSPLRTGNPCLSEFPV